ncbi:MAG: hypothetical protein LBV78_01640 [Kitasatospora sp.]|jgi:hypothetical protein|nr:hypothetical protein [Kitasatospora sp.]
MTEYAHLLQHTTRATELETQARTHAHTPALPRGGRRLRSRAGWLLVETGLRLVRPPAVPHAVRP